ncbi:MAG: helix-turn-helix transcriptional regulator [Flavobacteriales bacterium]|nr:helix-turn-helix transcriptional regulator [Flavobacteriales bacterium]
MDIGKKIKVLRAKKGISQQELADLINKTRTLISHIEVTSKVNFFTLTEIANALGVTVPYFTDDFTSSNIVQEDAVNYSTLSERVKKIERENELLNEIIQNQKEIISQLKEKIKA